MTSSYLYLIAITTILAVAFADKFDEEQYGVKYADHCEICKIVSNEITLLQSESDGKHEVLETGYSVQKEKKKTKVRVTVLNIYIIFDCEFVSLLASTHSIMLYISISVCKI